MDSSNPCNAVRESCASFESELAWVDRPAAESFAANADLKEIKTFCFSSHGISTNRFSEIPFPSHADEAGSYSLRMPWISDLVFGHSCISIVMVKGPG